MVESGFYPPQSQNLQAERVVLIIYGNFCCGSAEARLLAAQLYKLFWGEQPPFTPIGCGGRYFFKAERPMTNDEEVVDGAESKSCYLSLIRHSSFVLRHSKLVAARISWPAALAITALIVVGATLFIFLRLETWPARTIGQGTDDLERLGRDLRSAFIDIAHLQPRIRINNQTIVDEAASPVAELATLTKQIKVKREFAHTWAGSSKRIKLSGTFLAKAGFDLRQDVAVDVQPDEILVRMPHAEIVGVEETRVDVLALENGLWNHVSGTDLQNELAQLPEMARKQAVEIGLPADAEQELQRQLNKRIHARQPIHLVFTTSPTESPAPAVPK